MLAPINIFIIILIVPFKLCKSEDLLSESDQNSLRLLHVIFRHGNRTTIPEMLYPSDPHINETYYPFGQGELTNEGKKFAYNFGLEIRERYEHFLNEIYFPPDVKAMSSNLSRTQMTLQSVLAAVYPPVWPNINMPYLMWQPFSYETIPSKTDNLIALSCTSAFEVKTKMDFDFQDLYEYISKHAGSRAKSPFEAMMVYDAILVEKQNGFEVPDWAKDIFNNGKLQNAALSLWEGMIEQNLPLIAGNLIKKITEDSIKKTKQEIKNQVFYYSGHDTTIVGLLGVFEAYTKFEIEYLSHVFIEVHEIDNNYGFKVYFKNGPGYDLKQLKFKKCTDDFCKMEDFIASTNHLYNPEPKCE